MQPLEKLLLELPDNNLGFINLKNGDTLPTAQTVVLVKGPLGAAFKLVVNGTEVPASRVGKRSVLESKQLAGWEYIGVNLVPGENTLVVQITDPFGNVRGSETIKVVAPDNLGRIKLDVVPSSPADGFTPVRVRVTLTDPNDVPVTARTPLTLEATLGRWQVAGPEPARLRRAGLPRRWQGRIHPAAAAGAGRRDHQDLLAASIRRAGDGRVPARAAADDRRGRGRGRDQLPQPRSAQRDAGPQPRRLRAGAATYVAGADGVEEFGRRPRGAVPQGQDQGRLPAHARLRLGQEPERAALPRHPARRVLPGVRRLVDQGLRRPVDLEALRPHRQGQVVPPVRRLQHPGRAADRPPALAVLALAHRRERPLRDAADGGQQLRRLRHVPPGRRGDPGQRHLGPVHARRARRDRRQREGRDPDPRSRTAGGDPQGRAEDALQRLRDRAADRSPPVQGADPEPRLQPEPDLDPRHLRARPGRQLLLDLRRRRPVQAHRLAGGRRERGARRQPVADVPDGRRERDAQARPEDVPDRRVRRYRPRAPRHGTAQRVELRHEAERWIIRIYGTRSDPTFDNPSSQWGRGASRPAARPLQARLPDAPQRRGDPHRGSRHRRHPRGRLRQGGARAERHGQGGGRHAARARHARDTRAAVANPADEAPTTPRSAPA